jgi:integrase
LETRRVPIAAGKKRPPKPGGDRRLRAPVVQASCFEEIKAADISTFIGTHVEARSLAPKTANRYREILCRLFNWSMEERGVRLAGGKNPAAQVRRYRESAPRIRFLTLGGVGKQLDLLKDQAQMQTMVAMLIYAGLRREELLWLTVEDLDYATGTNGVIRIRSKKVDGAAWEPKTKVNRAVPISTALRAYLDKYRPMVSAGGWFFPTTDGKRWNPDWFSETLRWINKDAGLTWSNLDFRHTFGSQLAMKGESLFKIATLMGNSPEICRRHYAALVPEAMSETVEFPVTSGL